MASITLPADFSVLFREQNESNEKGKQKIGDYLCFVRISVVILLRSSDPCRGVEAPGTTEGYHPPLPSTAVCSPCP